MLSPALLIKYPSSHMQGLHDCFEEHEVPEKQLKSESYDTIQDRLRRETSRVDLSNIGKA